MEIRIVAEMLLKPGCWEALLPTLRTLVDGSRAEPGNSMYDLTESLDNPDHLFVIETWASEEAIAEHNVSPHFQAFVRGIEGKTERMTVSKLKLLL